jgi:uncharacterized membrane protein YphA (DoxX/SURF4 family)
MSKKRKLLEKSLRYFLGVIFFLYGLTKFFKMQKFGMDISGEITQLPSDQLFWYFFGYSYLYLIFLGIIECLGGILILIEKTKRFGVLLIFSLGANITLLDFIYQIGPVRFWALFLTILSSLLIWIDIAPYKKAFLNLIDSTNN